ncbi:MAG: Cof-type HAD-IIB family hydrolase [Paludibacteraceae bacterium]|nr:Cof-type HAD-IIB family hydrolase [Paludibacteraceae bacterium]
MIKLIALDLDGTLTNSRKELTPRNFDVLMKAQQMGVRLVLASGRPVDGIAPLAEQLHLAEYGGFVMAMNGSRLVEWQTQEVVHDLTLDFSFVPELYQAAMDAQMQILTYQGHAIVATSTEDEYVHKEAFINKMPVELYADFVHQLSEPINKCLIVGDPQRLPQVEANLRQQLSGRMDVYRSCDFFLECVPLGVDKAATLRLLCQHLHIQMEEVMACGDSYNDISMIQAAGVGVAMANSAPEVLTIADFVTRSNDEDGVAHAVCQYIITD